MEQLRINSERSVRWVARQATRLATDLRNGWRLAYTDRDLRI